MAVVASFFVIVHIDCQSRSVDHVGEVWFNDMCAGLVSIGFTGFTDNDLHLPNPTCALKRHEKTFTQWVKVA